MNNPMNNELQMILSRVEEGMTVVDSDGDKVGSVKDLQMGDEDPNTADVEVNEAVSPDAEPNWLTGLLSSIFVGDQEVDPAVRGRLLRFGYVRVDGLFSSPRYVIADQISHIDDDNQVILSVNKDTLLHS